MADDVVSDERLPSTGEIAGHPPPAGVRLEQRRIDRDCEALLINNIPNSAQTILPPPRYGIGIKGGDIELNPRGRQIDNNPVHQPASLYGCIQSFTTIGNAVEYFSGGKRVTALPKRG